MADNESASVTKDLGIVSAYGYAKAAGYTGTEEEFEQIFLEFTEDAPGLLDRLDEAVSDCEDAASDAADAKTAAENAQTAAEAAAATFETDTTLAVSGKAADAKVTGDEITGLKTALTYENAVENERDFIVDFHPVNGKYSTYPVTEVNKINNLFFLNGSPTLQSNTRFSLTGGVLEFSTSSPTATKVPNWYVNNLTDFIIGHKYLFKIELLSGTMPDVIPMFTLRTTDQSLNLSQGNGYVWGCNKQPNMVCFYLPLGSYSNCVFNLEIVDLTKLQADTAKNSGNYSYSIPAYFDSQLSTAISKINTDINSNKTVGTYGTDIESFVFITDVHWNANKQHSPALIKKILESCPIKTVVCGGDFIESSNETKSGAVAEIKGFTDAITQIPCYDYFAVYGNHDENSTDSNPISEQFTKSEQYNLLYAPFSSESNVHWIWEEEPDIYSETALKNDYYIDHARTKTRYLCIDWTHPYSTNRTNWITSVLAKNDGFRVVVIYHGIYKVVEDVLTPEHDTIMTILSPYKSKIVAVFCGHAHKDAVVDYYEDGSVPVILTSCDKFSETAGAEANTVKEQCFDVAVIDYGQSKIELTRIGRGSDRTVNISVS